MSQLEDLIGDRPDIANEYTRRRLEEAADIILQDAGFNPRTGKRYSKRQMFRMAQQKRAREMQTTLPKIEDVTVSLEEVMGWLGRTRMTIDNMVKRGELPEPRKFGGRLYWNRVELEAKFDEVFGPSK